MVGYQEMENVGGGGSGAGEGRLFYGRLLLYKSVAANKTSSIIIRTLSLLLPSLGCPQKVKGLL